MNVLTIGTDGHLRHDLAIFYTYMVKLRNLSYNIL